MVLRDEVFSGSTRARVKRTEREMTDYLVRYSDGEAFTITGVNGVRHGTFGVTFGTEEKAFVPWNALVYYKVVGGVATVSDAVNTSTVAVDAKDGDMEYDVIHNAVTSVRIGRDPEEVAGALHAYLNSVLRGRSIETAAQVPTRVLIEELGRRYPA